MAPVLGGTWIPFRGGEWHQVSTSQRPRPGRAAVAWLGLADSSAWANPDLGATGATANRDPGENADWPCALPRAWPTGLGFKRPPRHSPRRRAGSLAVHRAGPTCRWARRSDDTCARRLCTCARDIEATASTSRTFVVVGAGYIDCSVCPAWKLAFPFALVAFLPPSPCSQHIHYASRPVPHRFPPLAADLMSPSGVSTSG